MGIKHLFLCGLVPLAVPALAQPSIYPGSYNSRGHSALKEVMPAKAHQDAKVASSSSGG
jgi:hypothetical protein